MGLVMSTTTSVADDIQQRTYSDCSPAVSDVSGNVTLKCTTSDRRVAVPLFKPSDTTLMSGPLLDQLRGFVDANLGRVVFISLDFVADGSLVAVTTFPNPLWIDYSDGSDIWRRTIQLEELPSSEGCIINYFWKIVGFYLVRETKLLSVTLRHIADDKILLNPKYDPPR
jgi:hypothetical protein